MLLLWIDFSLKFCCVSQLNNVVKGFTLNLLIIIISCVYICVRVLC